MWEVHAIAYKYNWGENEILSLPIKKRKKYVDMIRQQVEAETQTEEDKQYETD